MSNKTGKDSYQLAYRKTPLMSTSLEAASIKGTLGCIEPLPTKTTEPPDAVAWVEHKLIKLS